MKQLRSHQQDAVDSVDTSLPRQQIIMACGTGKTLVGIHAAKRFMQEERVGERVSIVVTVPTLGLLEQTYRAWRNDAPFAFDALAVCSQPIGGATNEDISLSDLSVKSTTNAEDVADFLSAPGTHVVFATYQSSTVLGDAQRKYGADEFGLAIVDEAHKTAGDQSSTFSNILTDTSIKVRKRLFMTATPRIKGDSGDDETRVVLSMDDEKMYGPRRYELNVREAIDRGLLSDFKLLVVGVTDAEVDRYLDQYGEAAEIVAAGAALSRAIDDYGLRSSLVYFNRIEASDTFARVMQRMAGYGTETFHVDGSMSLRDRMDVLDHIEDTDFTTIVSNSRCFTEGIDVPSLDSVMFADARSSDVDIVQCIGRAIRKNPHGDKEAKIILNVRVHENDDVDQIIDQGEFKKIKQIISGLESHDSELETVLRKFPRGENRERDELDKWIEYSLPREMESRVWDKFKSSLFSISVSRIGYSWSQNYNILDSFQENYDRTPTTKEVYMGVKIGAWAREQRSEYSKSNLSVVRINLLEKIPGWRWNLRGEDAWNENYDCFDEFVKSNGRLPFKNEVKSSTGTDLGEWGVVQRRRFKNNFLSVREIDLLNQIPGWHFGTKWDMMYELLFQFMSEYDRKPRLTEEFKNEKIGQWMGGQIKRHKENKLSKDKIELFEIIPGWTWKSNDASWDHKFTLTKKFTIQYNRLPKDKEIFENERIGTWVRNQISRYRQGKLPEERIKLLESLSSWHW